MYDSKHAVKLRKIIANVNNMYRFLTNSSLVIIVDQRFYNYNKSNDI